MLYTHNVYEKSQMKRKIGIGIIALSIISFMLASFFFPMNVYFKSDSRELLKIEKNLDMKYLPVWKAGYKDASFMTFDAVKRYSDPIKGVYRYTPNKSVLFAEFSSILVLFGVGVFIYRKPSNKTNRI